MARISNNEVYAPNIAAAVNAAAPAMLRPVRLAATSALAASTYAASTNPNVGGTLTLNATGTLTIDGVLTALGDRLLLTAQATGSQNGIYVCTTAGATGVAAVLTRDRDAMASGDFVPGMCVTTGPEGTANANTAFELATAAPITLDTTSLTFSALQAVPGTLQARQNAFHSVRGVVTTNVATLSAFASVSGGTIQDGVTYAAGDRVLLVGQSTGSQNGIYAVGTVGSGTAPLTRPADWQTGQSLPASTMVVASEGFTGAGTIWLQTAAAPITIDTTATTFTCIASQPSVEPSVYKARMVVTANVASLANFAGVTGGSSTNSDGVLAVAGDIVLLAAQTTAAQNGPYVVGTVGGGVAPLTRPAWYTTGSTQPGGAQINVGGEGTVFKNTTWKAFVAADTYVVDTTDGKWYPISVTFTAALQSGTLTAGASNTSGAPAVMPIFSANTNIAIVRKTASTPSATVNGYALNGAPTPGVCGTGAISVMACVAAGTINNADGSTLICTVMNQI